MLLPAPVYGRIVDIEEPSISDPTTIRHTTILTAKLNILKQNEEQSQPWTRPAEKPTGDGTSAPISKIQSSTRANTFAANHDQGRICASAITTYPSTADEEARGSHFQEYMTSYLSAIRAETENNFKKVQHNTQCPPSISGGVAANPIVVIPVKRNHGCHTHTHVINREQNVSLSTPLGHLKSMPSTESVASRMTSSRASSKSSLLDGDSRCIIAPPAAISSKAQVTMAIGSTAEANMAKSVCMKLARTGSPLDSNEHAQTSNTSRVAHMIEKFTHVREIPLQTPPAFYARAAIPAGDGGKPSSSAQPTSSQQVDPIFCKSFSSSSSSSDPSGTPKTLMRTETGVTSQAGCELQASVPIASWKARKNTTGIASARSSTGSAPSALESSPPTNGLPLSLAERIAQYSAKLCIPPLTLAPHPPAHPTPLLPSHTGSTAPGKRLSIIAPLPTSGSTSRP